MLEKTEVKNVYRDLKSGALVNKDFGKLNAYKLKKQKMREQKEKDIRIDALEEEVKLLKTQVETLMHSIKTIKERVYDEWL